ncbi:MAG: gp53-like domain-containing protein [Shewanella sp.]
MPKPSTPAVWASGKIFSFTPSAQQIAQGFDYIATIGRPEGAPITDDHDWPFNQVTQALKWVMDQIPDAGIKSAASRDVGTGSSQIPDMSSFSSGERWAKLPNGKIFQWGSYTGSSQSGTIQLPIPFVKDFAFPVMSLRGSAVSSSVAYVIQNDAAQSKSEFSFISIGSQPRFNWYCVGE